MRKGIRITVFKFTLNVFLLSFFPFTDFIVMFPVVMAVVVDMETVVVIVVVFTEHGENN